MDEQHTPETGINFVFYLIYFNFIILYFNFSGLILCIGIMGPTFFVVLLLLCRHTGDQWEFLSSSHKRDMGNGNFCHDDVRDSTFAAAPRLSHKLKSELMEKPGAGDETGCNVAKPNPPHNVLADGPRAHHYTIAQPTSCRGGLGCVTLQPTPEPSHSISVRCFWFGIHVLGFEIQEYQKES